MQIYYSNPYHTGKNIGKAINDFCSIVPSMDDWIVMQDGDILYLTSDWGKKIYDALESEGDKFGLVGCYTNRLRGIHQLEGGKLSFNHDLTDHYLIARKYTLPGIQDIGSLGVAGFFMTFKKSTWARVGGFEENTIVFDTRFNIMVRSLGLKIGLIRSLYVYHSYRIWNDIDPCNDSKHLK